MTATALSSWALLIWEEFSQRRLDANRLFKTAGLDPAKLGEPTARFPVTNMSRLWNTAWEATQDEQFGIATGLRWSATSFHALGFAWLASDSLGDGLHRFIRYGRIVNDNLSYDLSFQQLMYRFTAATNNKEEFVVTAPADALRMEASACALLKMCRQLLGDAFSPISLFLPSRATGANLELERLFRCPIHYSADNFQLVIAREDVERKLATANLELSQLNEQVIIKHLAQLDQHQLSARIQNLLLELMPAGKTQESEAAKALGLSGRTLQRRLAEENTSFSQLLQSTRQQLAERYIRDNQLSFNEIGYLLGFSEQANFSRAFKRWTGLSPTAYRQQLLIR